MPPRIRNKGQLRKNLLRETVPTEKAGYRADVLISIALQLRKTALRLRKTTPIAKPDYLKYLEIMGKVLTLVSTLGLIIGCGMAFVYLKNIDFISVFPDVIKDPSSLITVIVVVGFLILFLGMSFFSPYLLSLPKILENSITVRIFNKRELFLILSFAIICYVAIFILIGIIPEWTWDKSSQTNISWIIIYLIEVIIIKLFLQDLIGFEKITKFIILILIITLIIFINLTPTLSLLFFFPLLDGVDNETWQYILLIGYSVLLLFNNFIAAVYLSS